MATKSILKNVVIKEKHMGRQLVNALEKTYKANANEIKMSKPYTEVSGEKIKHIFGA